MSYFDEFKRVKGRREDHDELTEKIIGAAIEVHRYLGPGHLEIAYRRALCHELELLGIACAKEVPFNVMYKGVEVSTGRLDLVIEGKVIVELKAIERLAPLHTAQCISYLRMSGLHTALLINFNVPILKEGLKRISLTNKK